MKNAAMPTKANTRKTSGQDVASGVKSKVTRKVSVPSKVKMRQAPGQDTVTSITSKVVESVAFASKAKLKGRPAANGIKSIATKKPAVSTQAKTKQISLKEAAAGGVSKAGKNVVAPSKTEKKASNQDAGASGGGRASKNSAKVPDVKAPDAALLAAYAEAAGPTAGDAVFEHPLVTDLLFAARRQVLAALRQQKCPVHEAWLICIRTYGRARPIDDSDLVTCLKRLAKKMEKVPTPQSVQQWAGKFAKAGITSYTELVEALQNPDELRKRMAEIPGENSTIHRQVLERLAKATSEHEAKSLKPTKGMQRGMLDLTLKSLELALGKEAHKHCLIFVSHEDADYTSGRYHEALAGTPWRERIVVGVKGAHHQVRFIEEAAPVGTHLVVADDNIDSIIVEIANEKNISKFLRPEGKGCITRCLRHHEFEDLLEGVGLQSVPEDRLQRFLRAADEKFNAKAKARELQEYSKTFSSADITTPAGLVKALSRPKQSLDQRLHKLAKPSMLKKLQAQLKGDRLPVQRCLVKAKSKAASKTTTAVRCEQTSELASLIQRAGQEMKDTGANVWSVNPSKNSHFMHGRGNDYRRHAKQYGYCQDTSSTLGLVYGAFFGFRALHDPERYTRFGQIKDDVERSLRYWHKDGIILRFNRYAVIKAQPPGKFHASKGGISAGSSEEAHKERGHQALKAILDDFASPYARFPKAGERCGDCGLIWEGSKLRQLGCKSKKRKQPDNTESRSEAQEGKRRKLDAAGDE